MCPKRKSRLLIPCGMALALLFCHSLRASDSIAPETQFTPSTTPAFQVDYPAPTADKPQSKLWYGDGCWWALLPRKSGPSLWQRTAAGWREHTEVTEALRGIPGCADVWPGENGMTAVAVETHTKTNPSATVFRLARTGNEPESSWKSEILSELFPPSPDDLIETATLVQDSTGAWLVAAVAGVKVCLWTAPPDAATWSGPVVFAEGIAPDDICVVTPLPGKQAGLIWSDQVREGFLMRVHTDGDDSHDWESETIIQLGDKAADDHLNTVLTLSGTLWLASKNEVDTDGKPQFTLHERSAEGAWRSWPYAVREATSRPSRPIVVASNDGGTVLTGYGDTNPTLPEPRDSKVVFSRVNPDNPDRIEAPRTVIAPSPALNSRIQNVTGPRHPFPVDAPWIVLASDQEGRIFEADLRAAFSQPTD